MRVYFDASVIIAGILSPQGGSAKLLELVRRGAFPGITSQTVIKEIESKHQKINQSVSAIAGHITHHKLLVRTKITKHDITQYVGMLDESDIHVVAGAIKTNCTHLVTLDKKHLLRPDIKKKFKSLNIVNPKELIKEYLEEKE